ncbi:MATE efflux family protein [Zalerion maritima]|uniref:MATE efflux family protein n=1 Tax=Zalerion maritima TaxID=339359 RepID=A0AAD5RG07_9PEZI|nr:MATE efflux family protein [Zalerion maritima]
MTPPLDIPIRKDDDSTSLDVGAASPRSFQSISEIAHEALIRDLAECSDEGDPDTETPLSFLSDEEEEGEDGELHYTPTLYRRPEGVAFGAARPVIGVVPASHDEGVLTKVEKKQCRDAERSLLRDNHFLPPKHPVSEHPNLFRRIYKHVFSTKVRGTGYDTFDEETTSETTPLIKTQSHTRPGHEGHEHLNEQWDAAVAAGQIHTTWQREAKTITVYSRSLILTFILHYSVTVTAIIAAGRIGAAELGAVSLATMTANITCYAPFQGLTTALDTLCAQAYGSGHKHLVGLQVQRMSFFLTVLSIPVAISWWFATDILRLALPNETASVELAGLYMRIMILGIPGVWAFECGKRFVQAQGLFHATTYALLMGAPLNILISWTLVKKLGLGFVGAPMAHAFTQLLLPLLLYLYVVFVQGSHCWGGFTKRAFHNWGPMVRLALPGMIMVEAEFLAFEILTLVAGRFGTDALAAQSVIVTLTSILYQIPFPLAIAASTRVANLIGSKVVEAAHTSAKVSIIYAAIVGTINMAILCGGRFYLPQFFTEDEEVISIVAEVLPICAILQLLEGLASMSHGLLRAIGRQSVGGYTNLFVYYSVALPLSFGTAYGLGWDLQGLWFGVTIGIFLVASIEYWFIYSSDWHQAVKDAEDRNASW